MNYANIKWCDVANGPGVRISLFVSGCRNCCKNCFNPETWSFSYGNLFTEQIEQQIIDRLQDSYIEGLTILGGDPFEPENIVVLIPFLEKVKKAYPDKAIWCYTGYLYEDLLVNYRLAFQYIDILVDGRFVDHLKDPTLIFCGSSNQRIIDVKSSIETNSIILWKENKR